jgi:hypothetical protein
MINRLYMKGYCDKHGFPREIPKISTLEPFAIIERYNSVMRGLANYYAEFIDQPKRQLSRWIYILRFSCLKTLAQKYKKRIRQILSIIADKTKRISKEKTVYASLYNQSSGA